MAETRTVPQGSLETNPSFRTEVLVRFADCDPAGIVFYPRFLEMFNNLVEDWCRDGLSFSFNEIVIQRGWGLPTVHLEADFVAPCRLGEVLTANLFVRSLGTSSINADIVLSGPDRTERVRGKVVLVLTDRRTGRALPLPDELRSGISAFIIAGSINIREYSREIKEKMKLLQPPDWPRPRGYANGVAAKGTLVFLSGIVGWTLEQEFAATDFVGQVRQALQNIVAILKEANAKPEHIVRMTWYVLDKNAYLSSTREMGKVYREIIGSHYPAMSVVEVSGLVETNALVEIEVTAVVPD